MKLKTFLQIFGAIAVVLTLLPFIAIDYWWIRVFDFPHFQLTTLTFLALGSYFIKFDIKSQKDYLFVSILFACLIFQTAKIYPYLHLAQFEVLESNNSDLSKSLKIYTANVLQENKKSEQLISEIKSNDADILLFTETDLRWKNEILPEIKADYKYSVEIPLSNTYGMLLYSKLNLIDPEIKFIVDDSIPSIHTLVKLPAGDTIQLFAIHPTPPMPQHNMSSTDRDAEMMKIAFKSFSSEYPVVVVGDFNDVAWSESTALFQSISGLLDVRKGRGFFNTYHANYFFLRWPLDHIFVSEHFRVKDIKRGADINSDHFPMYISLSYEPEGAAVQKAEPPTKEQLVSAQEQIIDEKKQEE